MHITMMWYYPYACKFEILKSSLLYTYLYVVILVTRIMDVYQPRAIYSILTMAKLVIYKKCFEIFYDDR